MYDEYEVVIRRPRFRRDGKISPPRSRPFVSLWVRPAELIQASPIRTTAFSWNLVTGTLTALLASWRDTRGVADAAARYFGSCTVMLRYSMPPV